MLWLLRDSLTRWFSEPCEMNWWRGERSVGKQYFLARKRNVLKGIVFIHKMLLLIVK